MLNKHDENIKNSDFHADKTDSETGGAVVNLVGYGVDPPIREMTGSGRVYAAKGMT